MRGCSGNPVRAVWDCPLDCEGPGLLCSGRQRRCREYRPTAPIKHSRICRQGILHFVDLFSFLHNVRLRKIVKNILFTMKNVSIEPEIGLPFTRGTRSEHPVEDVPLSAFLPKCGIVG